MTNPSLMLNIYPLPKQEGRPRVRVDLGGSWTQQPDDEVHGGAGSYARKIRHARRIPQMMFLRSLDDSTLWLVGAASFLVGSMGFAGWALVQEEMAVFSLPALGQGSLYWWVFWGFLVGAVGWGLQLTAFFRGGRGRRRDLRRPRASQGSGTGVTSPWQLRAYSWRWLVWGCWASKSLCDARMPFHALGPTLQALGSTLQPFSGPSQQYIDSAKQITDVQQ